MKTKQLFLGCSTILLLALLHPLMATTNLGNPIAETALLDDQSFVLKQQSNIDSLIPENLFLSEKAPYLNNTAELFGLHGSLARWRYYTDASYRNRVDMWNRIYNNQPFSQFDLESGFGLAGNTNTLPIECTILGPSDLRFFNNYETWVYYIIYGFPSDNQSGYLAQNSNKHTRAYVSTSNEATAYVSNNKLPTTKPRIVSNKTRKKDNSELVQHLAAVNVIPMWDAIESGEFKIKSQENISAALAHLMKGKGEKSTTSNSDDTSKDTVLGASLMNSSQTKEDILSNNGVSNKPTVLTSIKGKM